jgi:CDP-glucose 4,6-dehydratase
VGDAARAVESVVMHEPAAAFWKGRRVFVTGHTGFKGGWLSLWLHSMGAEVHGYALEPPTNPSFFDVANVERDLASCTIADIRDFARLSSALEAARPDVVFHFAAQPLVRDSYQHPVETYATNVMGVVHLLEAVRSSASVKALVNVTTDKCYENQERARGYREDEPMGGYDPYSSSKGCAELVTAAYRRSFLAGVGIAVATARAGNVIGGGDWGCDRLLPDFLRAIDAGTRLVIRSPLSTRPWQHVLEPLSGYLMLAERLYTDGAEVTEAWNFGPADGDTQTVLWIVEHLASWYPELSWKLDRSEQPHEAGTITLDSGKARARLGWQPRWRLESALEKTTAWHQAWRRAEDMHERTIAQIGEYVRAGADASCGAV